MRGDDKKQSSMLSLMTPAERSAGGPPAAGDEGARRRGAGGALADVRRDVQQGGTAVDSARAPPEGLLLMALYTVRSERLFCEQLDYNLLFRWFLDMRHGRAEPRPLDLLAEPRSAFRARRGEGISSRSVVEQAREARTAHRARAFLRRRDADRGVGVAQEFPQEGREARGPRAARRPGQSDGELPRREAISNETHESKTDPEAKLATQGRTRRAAKLSYSVSTR